MYHFSYANISKSFINKYYKTIKLYYMKFNEILYGFLHFFLIIIKMTKTQNNIAILKL